MFYKLNMQEILSNFLFVVKDLFGQITRVGDIIRNERCGANDVNVLLELYNNFVQCMSAQKTLPNF